MERIKGKTGRRRRAGEGKTGQRTDREMRDQTRMRFNDFNLLFSKTYH